MKVCFKTAALAVASLPSAVLGGAVADVSVIPPSGPQTSRLILEGGGYLLLEDGCRIYCSSGGRNGNASDADTAIRDTDM